jgi:phenylpropionate dioxygenase-like ring-hydroxylating dioxygenase large terminal subunit
MQVPVLDMDRLEGVPFPVATRGELRRAGMVQAEALGRKLVVFWNGGRPTVYEDACAHLGLPLSLGSVKGGRIVCRYHGWAFSTDDGEVVDQPTLRRPQACRLRRWGALTAGRLVFAWKGDPAAGDAVRRLLPEEIPEDVSVHRVVMDCPFYLALFNAVDYAHFSFHRMYSPVYSAYRRFRRDGHVPGDPFTWRIVGEDERAVSIRLEEASRDLKMYVTCAEFVDDRGVNQFQTYVTPLGPSKTLYWEVYRARSDSALIRFAAHAMFRAVVVPLLETEDRVWTSRAAPNFLAGDNIHLSATDVPLGAHLRKFILPRMQGEQSA